MIPLFFKYLFSAVFGTFLPLFLSLSIILVLISFAKKKKIKIKFLLPPLFITLSVILTYIADFAMLVASGEAHLNVLYNFIFYLAYWPSVLLKIKDLFLFNPLALTVNCVGWGIVGFIISIIIFKY